MVKYVWTQLIPFQFQWWRFAFGHPYASCCVIQGWKNIFWRVWWKL